MRITPYVMPMRCDAQVFLKHRADKEILSKYIRRQKMEHGEAFSYMELIVAACVRAVSQNPEANRFIMKSSSLPGTTARSPSPSSRTPTTPIGVRRS